MQISIIAAMTCNRTIGNANKLPWHIPEELQHFRAMTMGKPMIMGRATFDSMGRRLLPGRQTIVLSRQPMAGTGFIVADSVAAALHAAGDAAEVMVVGGSTIYQQFLPHADKMYLSVIAGDYPGDAFFPEYDPADWRLVSEEQKPLFVVRWLERVRKRAA